MQSTGTWLSGRHARIVSASIAVVLVFALAVGVLAPRARADGDPASDYLLTNQVFLSAQTTSMSSAQRQLVNLVAEANRKGLALRVALVPTEYDMGSITELWRQPRLYARFLGLELGSTYRGRLLVVMPDGIGVEWSDHAAGPMYGALAAVRVAPGDQTLATAGEAAVERLASTAGLRLAVPTGSSRLAGTRHAGARAGDRTVLILLAVLACGVAGGAWMLSRRRGRSRSRRRRRPALSRAALAPAILALLVLAVGAPIVIVRQLRGSSAAATDAGTIITPPPYAWPPGRRAAPDFGLRGENGRPVSLAAYRGRPVILTFVDPLCRNLCPLEAHLLNQVVGEMSPRERPAIVAVSVDVYADTRADLRQDDRQWRLVPEWNWAVGAPSALAAVWRQYSVGVNVVTKHIAGTTIRYITHTEAAYVIDGTGHERALFLWPFYPQDLEHVLQPLVS